MVFKGLIVVIAISFVIKIKGESKKTMFDDDRIFNEIVGGSEAEPSNYPYIATLQAYGYHFCGGSILRIEYPAMVLTAAHCLYNQNYYDIVVRLFTKDADVPNHNSIDTTIADAIIHPDYNPNTYDNDVMILWLNEFIEHYPYLHPVMIEPNTMNGECCQNNADLQVIGYGNDCYQCQNTPTLEYVNVGYVDRSTCKYQFFGPQLTENMNCAGELPHGGSDACQGDSGGPIIRTGTNKQIGIVSWGYGCASHYPGVYADVGVFYHWIQEKMHMSMHIDSQNKKENELLMIRNNRKTDSFFNVKSQHYYFGMSVSGFIMAVAILYYHCKNREYESILDTEKNEFV